MTTPTLPVRTSIRRKLATFLLLAVCIPMLLGGILLMGQQRGVVAQRHAAAADFRQLLDRESTNATRDYLLRTGEQVSRALSPLMDSAELNAVASSLVESDAIHHITIYRSNQSLPILEVGEQVSGFPFQSAINDGHVEVVLNRLGGFIPPRAWSTSVLAGEASTRRSHLAQLAVFVLSFAMMALLVGAVALFGTDRIVLDRLRQLAATTIRIARGDRSARACVGGDDEIDLLARHMNSMVDESMRSREQLEDGIRERTAQLFATNQELERTFAAAQEATKAKSDFLAIVSHEIRTPMNGIIGMAELLSVSGLNEKQQVYANAMRHSADGLLRIVGDVLDFSKVEAGKIELESAPFDLSLLLEELTVLNEPACAAKGILIELKSTSAVPVSVRGDQLRLRQVLNNLIGNAIKFTERGRVSITADYRGAKLYMGVHDTGIGIEPGQHAALFDSFTQAEPSTSRKYGGCGLGLAISSRLVKLMGGVLELESHPGVGSSFTFNFELEAVVADSVEPQTYPSDAHTSCTTVGLSGYCGRVLLVEDNQVNRMVAGRMLEHFGLTVVTAENGRAAVELFEHSEFDLVFMDCQMPMMDGCEATRLIRRNNGGKSLPPIVALSGLVDGEILFPDMDDCLAKPLTLSSLETVLAKYLPNKRNGELSFKPGPVLPKK